jgi:TP901 family phage tail tape measure protein
MAVQINVAANQAALISSIQAGVQAYNQRFANNNQINLNINARAFSQPLGRITGDVKDFEAALAASNARVIAFGASTAVLGGVIRSFKELASVTIDVEKNLADINRVFGLSTSQLQKFSTELFNVSKQTASTFDNASKAALEFSRQGLKAEETLQRTKDALTLTRLAGIGTANAVDALTSTVNGFAATGVTTSQILNKLIAVEQDFAVGAGDLAEALSRTGQAAQEAGVSLDQLNALVTSAQQSTARGGAVIGNALKTIFTRLQRTETLDQLEMFNIAVRDVQGNILPAVTILQNFAGAYKNLADAQRAQLSEQVAGVYQVNILKAIVNDLNQSQGVYAGALQRGASATNEAEIATAKLNKTLDALLSQTATSAQQLANNIGKVTFEPLARYGTEQLKSLVESMNEILEGEGVGSTFANGLLKGIRNILAGPGAIAAFFTLFKLIQNSFSFLTQALPQIAGITTETQNRKNIEQSILQIMQQQGPISQALAASSIIVAIS